MNGRIGLQGTCLPSHSFTHEKKSDQKEESFVQGPAARKENNLTECISHSQALPRVTRHHGRAKATP